jgi:hypothetical protein
MPKLTRAAISERIKSSAVVAAEWYVTLSDDTEIPFRVIPIDLQGRLGSILGFHQQHETPPDELGPIMLRAAIRWAVMDGELPVFESDDQVRDWLRTLAKEDQGLIAEAAQRVHEESGFAQTTAEGEEAEDVVDVGKASSKPTLS